MAFLNSKLRYILPVLCLFAIELAAETGMCLVVTSTKGVYDFEGDIRRIDLKDGTVFKTSGKIGFGRSPRFAPDGNSFAYIKGSTVCISSLEGNVLKQFNVVTNSTGNTNISFTDKGIYVCAKGKFYLYDLNGNKTWEKAFDHCRSGYVSRNGKTGGGVDKISTWSMMIFDMATGATKAVTDEQGCSVCPSPEGNLLTKNRGDHTSMNVRDNKGNVVRTLRVQEVTGKIPKLGNWGWNRQMWSGNSQDVIIIPVGQDTKWSGCIQLNKNMSPWIYNLKENKGYQLAKRTSDWWQPYDYYQGKIPGSQPDFSLSLPAVEFTVALGGSTPADKNIIVTAIGGLSLDNLNVSENAGWLTVTLSGAGDTRNLSNSVNIAGLGAGNYSTVVTVKAGTISKTYKAAINVVDPGSIHLKMNAGPNTVAGWEADDAYIVKGADYTKNESFDLNNAPNAGPVELYQTCSRAGPVFNFAAIPDGRYTVRLHFADPAYDASATSSNRRINVTVEDKTVLSNYDVVASAGGGHKVDVKQFDVTVSDGNGMTITLSEGSGNDAFICGIEIIGKQSLITAPVPMHHGGAKELSVTADPGGSGIIRINLAKQINSQYNVLYVYNPAGRIIKKLVSGNTGRGQEFIWNTTAYPSGTYILDVRYGKNRSLKKLILTK